MIRTSPGPSGFTLTELAVVLAIVGILLASLLLPLGTQMEQRQIGETRQRLEEAREALLAFTVIHGRLPCPATAASAGLEAPAGGGACTSPHGGFLPARTLGLLPQDANGLLVDVWANPVRYAVSSVGSNTFTTAGQIRTQANTNGFNATALQPDLRLCATATGATGLGGAGAACAGGQDLVTTSPGTLLAVVFSIGKTNFGSADEAANTTADRLFVTRAPAPAEAVAGGFDDIVLAIPVGLLLGRMLNAGALP